MVIGNLPTGDLEAPGAVHHHTHLTHRHALWAAVLLVGVALRVGCVIGVILRVLLHIGLDTIAGAIARDWRLTDTATKLVVLPAMRGHWLSSFLHHAIFRLERAFRALAAHSLWLRFRRGAA